MRNLIPHFIHQQFEQQNVAGRFRAAAMFVDVSGFISFEASPSPADLDAFVTWAMDAAADYGGTFNKLDFGDKDPVMLVLFGAPVAHENDLERAANFLLTLRDQAALRNGIRLGGVGAARTPRVDLSAWVFLIVADGYV